MHFYINCGFLLFFGGCFDLVRFGFFILQLALSSGVVVGLEIYMIGSLSESVCCLLCSVYYLWCLFLIYLFAIYLCYLFNLLNLLLWYCSSLGISWAWSFRVSTPEKVRGNKASGLQTEVVACKWQIFLFLLSGRRKQTIDILFFLLNTNL